MAVAIVRCVSSLASDPDPVLGLGPSQLGQLDRVPTSQRLGRGGRPRRRRCRRPVRTRRGGHSSAPGPGRPTIDRNRTAPRSGARAHRSPHRRGRTRARFATRPPTSPARSPVNPFGHVARPELDDDSTTWASTSTRVGELLAADAALDAAHTRGAHGMFSSPGNGHRSRSSWGTALRVSELAVAAVTDRPGHAEPVADPISEPGSARRIPLVQQVR